ncbi:Ceramide synthase [Labeo rohita]|uniref:Ceramide synthase n=1 Tax=Labeo rohita TaxID=84645 RepID=A0ABQ8MAL2_LABRO|nr:Ceramide synthase [Labeo rohita]
MNRTVKLRETCLHAEDDERMLRCVCLQKREADGRDGCGRLLSAQNRQSSPAAIMLSIIAAGSVFFPGLFLLSKQCLKSIPGLRWSEGDAVVVSARLVSSIQAIMASTAGYVISTSCQDIIEDQHWLTSSYILFAVPYFVYDIYAMFLCYWYKLQVKGHEVDNGSRSKAAAVSGYLRREFLMILHHVVMVTVCFPVSVVTAAVVAASAFDRSGMSCFQRICSRSHLLSVCLSHVVFQFWRQGKGDYFQGVMFLAELSTPSVCLGKILIQNATDLTGRVFTSAHVRITYTLHVQQNTSSKMKRTIDLSLTAPGANVRIVSAQYKQQHTLLHKVNGAAMLITFFLCRVLLFPYLYYMYGRYASIPFYRVPFAVPWQCNVGAALLMAPQLYWFSLICRGALRLFTGSSSRSRRPAAPGKPDYDGHEPLPQAANGYSARMAGRDTPTISH